MSSVLSEEQAGPNTHGSARIGGGGVFLHLCGLAVTYARLAAEAVILLERVVGRNIDS